MSPRRAFVVVLALLVSLGLAAPAPAASTQRIYEGETSQRGSVHFNIVKKSDGSFGLLELEIQMEVVCKRDRTSFGFGYGIFFGRAVPLEGRELHLDQGGFTEVLHVDGVFRPRSAQGTLEFTMASLTENEKLQKCTTGEVDWTAERLA